MYCSHSIVFRSTTSEASINRISFNRYRLSFNLHHSLFFHISINHRYLIVGVLSGVRDFQLVFGNMKVNLLYTYINHLFAYVCYR
ncbi:hypothetical protein Hanom_Chr11g01000981 [Helianthus anomalus]